MKSLRLLMVVLPLISSFLVAQNTQGKKKHILPAVFNAARYVFVESMDGDIFTPGLLPEDRQAISDVQNELDDWGRYVLTINRGDADLIFVVRKGRLGAVKLGGTVGTRAPGQQGSTPVGVIVGAEGGPPDDLLEVCMPGGSAQTCSPIWQRTEVEGLASPDVPLFQQLKKTIEHDYPPTTSQNSKP